MFEPKQRNSEQQKVVAAGYPSADGGNLSPHIVTGNAQQLFKQLFNEGSSSAVLPGDGRINHHDFGDPAGSNLPSVYRPTPPKSAPLNTSRPKPFGQIDTGRGLYATKAQLTFPAATENGAELVPLAPRAPFMNSSVTRGSRGLGTTSSSARATSTLLRQLHSITLPDNSAFSQADVDATLGRLQAFQDELRAIIACNEVRQRNLIHKEKLTAIAMAEERLLALEECLLGRQRIIEEESVVWTGTGPEQQCIIAEGPSSSIAAQRLILEEHSARTRIESDGFGDEGIFAARVKAVALNCLLDHANVSKHLEMRCIVEWKELLQRACQEGTYWESLTHTQARFACWLKSSPYLILKLQQEARGDLEDVWEERARHRIGQDQLAALEVISAAMYRERRWHAEFDIPGDEAKLRQRLEVVEERAFGVLLETADESWLRCRKQTQLSREVVHREEVIRGLLESEEQKEWLHVATWAHRRWYTLYCAARELVESPSETLVTYEVEVTDSDVDDDDDRNHSRLGADNVRPLKDATDADAPPIALPRYQHFPVLRTLIEAANDIQQPTGALRTVIALGHHHRAFHTSPTPPESQTPSPTKTTTAKKGRKTKTITRTIEGSVLFVQQAEAFGRRDILESYLHGVDGLSVLMCRQRAPLLAQLRQRQAVVESYIDGRMALLQQEASQWETKIERTWLHNHFHVSQRDATRWLTLDEAVARAEVVREADAAVRDLWFVRESIGCFYEEHIERGHLVAREMRTFKLVFGGATDGGMFHGVAKPFVVAALQSVCSTEQSGREQLLEYEVDHWSFLNTHIRSVLEGGGSNLEIKYLREQEGALRVSLLRKEQLGRLTALYLPHTETLEAYHRGHISALGKSSMVSAQYLYAAQHLEAAHRRDICNVKESAAWLRLLLLSVEDEECIQRRLHILDLESDVRATLFLFHCRSQPLFVFESSLLAVEREEASARTSVESRAELGTHALLRVVREDLYPNTLGRVMDPTTGRNHLLELQESRAVTYVTPRNVDNEHKGTLEKRAREYVGRATRAEEHERSGGLLWKKASLPNAPTTFGVWLLQAFDEINDDENAYRELFVLAAEASERAAIGVMLREAQDRESIARLQEQLWTATHELWSRIETRELTEAILIRERVVARCEEDDRAHLWVRAREETLALLSHRDAFYLQLENEQRERLLLEQGPLLQEFYDSRFEIASEEHRRINSLLDTFRWGCFILLRRDELESRLIRRDCCVRYYHYQDAAVPLEADAAAVVPDEVLISELVEAELTLPAPPTVDKSFLPPLWTREELLQRYQDAKEAAEEEQQQRRERSRAKEEKEGGMAGSGAQLSDHYSSHMQSSFGHRDLAEKTTSRDTYMRRIVEGSGLLFAEFHQTVLKEIEPAEDVERRRLMGSLQNGLQIVVDKARRRASLLALQAQVADLEKPGTATHTTADAHIRGNGVGAEHNADSAAGDRDEVRPATISAIDGAEGVTPAHLPLPLPDGDSATSTPALSGAQTAVSLSSPATNAAPPHPIMPHASSNSAIRLEDLFTYPPRYLVCQAVCVPLSRLQGAADSIAAEYQQALSPDRDVELGSPEGELEAEFCVTFSITDNGISASCDEGSGHQNDVTSTPFAPLPPSTSMHLATGVGAAGHRVAEKSAMVSEGGDGASTNEAETVTLVPEYVERVEARWRRISASGDRRLDATESDLLGVRDYLFAAQHCQWMNADTTAAVPSPIPVHQEGYDPCPSWCIPLPNIGVLEGALPLSILHASLDVVLRHVPTNTVVSRRAVFQGYRRLSSLIEKEGPDANAPNAEGHTSMALVPATGEMGSNTSTGEAPNAILTFKMLFPPSPASAKDAVNAVFGSPRAALPLFHGPIDATDEAGAANVDLDSSLSSSD